MIRAMMIIGAFALVVGLTLYTLLDALRTHQDQMRTFPKWLWIIAVIFFPVVGPLLWLLLGRPRAVRAPKTQQGSGFTSSRRGTPPPATSSPDDDEEYLRWLKAKAERQKRDRQRQEPRDDATDDTDGEK
jgi:hypothetical protein